ncbi:hypothetical protein [Candidatus Palauibacter sp.]|uniref:hypothetical protein n=1 Tax=Candidatus Palauibacter sp. TaxID=3101350 RepID=UPI003B523EE3
MTERRYGEEEVREIFARASRAGVALDADPEILPRRKLLGFPIADGKAGAPMIMPAMLGLGGAAALVAAALRLPRWASERERQMEHIAAWTRDLLSAAPGNEE